MATIIEMPKLSDTMTVGTVANWLKNEGDDVATGDVIAEIETDKATMELEAFEDGVLLKQIAKAGEQVAIGGPIGAIGAAGENVEIPATSEAPSASEPETEQKAPRETPQENPTPAAPTPPAAPQDTVSDRIKASPLAKKLAQQHGLDLSKIAGTGPNARIVKADVLQAANSSSAPASPSTAAAHAGPGVANESDLPVSRMRAVIAQRLVECKNTVPHFYLEMEIDAAALLLMRAQLNSELEASAGIKLTVNDFILKASAEAIRRVPAMNRAWNGSSIRQNSAVHMAFGVAIDDGLLTPVIRNADSKGLRQIATEAKDLIGKARSKKLKPDEMTGSTFTVTNLGMFGVSSFYGIINPPNAGILSVGATITRPAFNEKGEVVPAKIMKVGLSGDHRAIDGAVGAQYLQALKKIIEAPALILV